MIQMIYLYKLQDFNKTFFYDVLLQMNHKIKLKIRK